MVAPAGDLSLRRVGRYAVLDAFASGGMATIHFGRQLGEAGFGRVVAIKRLHPHLASDPEFAAMFLDEARMAARIRHPNVASTLDVVADGSELLMVMDYIAGEPLSAFIARRQTEPTPIPPAVASAIVGDALLGLHAAHEARSEAGEPLGIVHRDVSPQNLLVGLDGVTRVIDFGVAKAAGRMHVTRENCVKGKITYMAPEQLRAEAVSRRSDVYSAAVVLWECLTGRRLMPADGNAAIEQVLLGDFDPTEPMETRAFA